MPSRTHRYPTNTETARWMGFHPMLVTLIAMGVVALAVSYFGPMITGNN